MIKNGKYYTPVQVYNPIHLHKLPLVELRIPLSPKQAICFGNLSFLNFEMMFCVVRTIPVAWSVQCSILVRPLACYRRNNMPPRLI